MSLSDLGRGLKALADSRPAYEEGESYYSGKVDEFFADSKIAEKIKQAGSPYKLAFAAIPVDARVGLLDVSEITSSTDAVTEVLRRDVWDANELDQDMPEVFRQAGYFGDYFVTVWENEDDERKVDVFLNSPLTTRIIYSKANARKALYGIRVWEADEQVEGQPTRYRVNLSYTDRIEQYITAPGKKSAGADDFVAFVDEDDDEGDNEIENPYDQLPIFHFRQGSKPYGTPIHARAYGSQDAITKLASTHMSTVDYLGYPQRYALLDADADDDADDSEFFDYDTSGIVEPGQEVELKKKRSKLKSGPAETWWLSGVKEVGQFDAATHEPFLEPLKFHVRAMARLTNTPAAEFDIETGEVPSGESYSRSYVPLFRDANTLRRGHGATLSRMLEFALKVLGYEGEKVTITWAPLQVAAGKEDWEIIGLKVANGVPLRKALAEAGYPEGEITKWYPDDEPAFSPDMLAKVAAAMASFATPTTLGLITPADVRAAYPEFFTDDRTEEPVVLPTADAEVDPTLDLEPVADPNAAALASAQTGVARAEELKAKADALGAFVRAGADQDAAAKLLGLEGLTFSSVPTTVRLNDQAAGEFESKDGTDPAAAPTPAVPPVE